MLFNNFKFVLQSLAVASIFTSTLAAPLPEPVAAIEPRSFDCDGIVASLNVFVGLYSNAGVHVNAGVWAEIPNDLALITAHVTAHVALLKTNVNAFVSVDDGLRIHASLSAWTHAHQSFLILLNTKHPLITLGALVDSTHGALLNLNLKINLAATALYAYIPSNTCKNQFSTLYTTLQVSIEIYAKISLNILGIHINL
ncbi:hypothetical protein RQP46_001842 [Phenoliferia psychrophenolica]